MRKYCRHKIKEYCRDSKSYLEAIHQWKKNCTDVENLYLVAADVQALYPSIPREMVRISMKHALETCSHYSSSSINTLINLTMYCLDNLVVQYRNNFYNQNEGIVTGDNHSVSLANIALHYLLLPIENILNKTILFQRYIDDIIWFSQTDELTNEIQRELSQAFGTYGLKLVFRRISTSEENKSVEFLDVNHIVRLARF